MCEDKFLVKTNISRNNVIEQVFVEPWRCGLKIVKKGHDWKCLDLNAAAAAAAAKDSKKSDNVVKEGGGGARLVKNTCTVGESIVGRNCGGQRDRTVKTALNGTKVDGQVGHHCLSNNVVGQQSQVKVQQGTRPQKQYSTLLSLLNSGSGASSGAPQGKSVPPRQVPCNGQFQKPVQIKQEPGISTANRSNRIDKESQTIFKKPRKVANVKPKRSCGSDLLLSTLLAPDPLLRLQLANWFMVPPSKSGQQRFPNIPPRPFSSVSKLKMLFDEDGTGDSGDPHTAKPKIMGDEDSNTSTSTGKRGREQDDDDINSDVTDVVKKVKVEQQQDGDLNNDDGDSESNQNDQNSNESFPNKQNGLDANLQSNGSSKTGDSSGDSSPSRESTQESSSSNNTKKPSSSNQQPAPRRSNFSQCLSANPNGASAVEDKKENGFNNLTVSKTVSKSSNNSVNSSSSKLRNSLAEAGNSTAASSVASSSNNSESGENTKVLQLEREIASLGSLLNAKEREWNAILELKKLKELAIEYYRRQKDVEALCDEEAIQEHDDYLKRLTARISALSDKIGPDEAQVRSSTTKTENEIKEADKNMKIVNGQVKKNTAEVKEGEPAGDSDAVKIENFQASLALQQLCERNKALSQVTPVLSSGTSSATNKVIGEGRQGAIVEVRSIIADYRSKNPDDGTTTGSENRKRNSKKQPTVVNNVSNILSQNRNASFRDILVNLAKLSQNEKNGVPTISVATEITKSTTKNSSGAQASTNRGSTGTLAKLLSSNNGISTVEDGSNGRSDALTLSNGGDNISLANLLAGSSRPRDDELNDNDEEMVPVCQGCNNSRAQFVCAGCGNQWYCSRECQVTAWEHHSEVCSG